MASSTELNPKAHLFLKDTHCNHQAGRTAKKNDGLRMPMDAMAAKLKYYGRLKLDEKRL
jgi:hypothetical protein